MSTTRIVDTEPVPPSSWHALASLATIIAGFVVWISLIGEPQQAAGDHLDRSWKESYGWFFKHNLQAGKDYIFTSGPLGHFYNPVYDADLFWLDYYVELAVKSWLAFVFLRFVWSMPSLLGRLAYCASISVPILLIGFTPDSMWVLAVVLSLVTIVRGDKILALRDIVPFSLTIAIVSLMKFTLLVLGIVALGVLIVNLIVKQNFKMLLLLLVCSFSAFLTLWVACHQSIWNLPIYLVRSMDIAVGYAEAMSTENSLDRPYLILAITSLFLFFVAWIPISLVDRRQLSKLQFWSVATAIAAALGLSWKHAFVRADLFHIPGFFWILLPLTFLSPVLLPSYDWKMPLRVGALSGCGFLSLYGFLAMAHRNDGVSLSFGVPSNFLGHLSYVFLPSDRKQRLEKSRRELAVKFDLPKIKERVGNATVDILSYQQGVLFLNDLNWNPRPVFQSYTTYTPKLLAMNAEFYRSSRAPKFVIIKLQTIDDRLPTADDGLALHEILWRYRPLFEERSYLLLERRVVATQKPVANVGERSIQFDEQIALNAKSGGCQTIGLKVQLSTAGKLQKLLYQAPKLYIALSMADGTINSFRIVPAMAEQGILLNPLLVSNKDLEDFFRGSRGNQVESIRIHRSNEYGFCDEIQLRIESFPIPDSGRIGIDDVES